jgi:hypothetical protein
MLDAVHLDLVARILREQDLVAFLDVQLANGSVFLELAVADGNDLALLGLFLGRVGNEESAGGLGLFLDALDENSVIQARWYR